MRHSLCIMLILSFCSSPIMAIPVKYHENGNYYELVMSQLTWTSAKDSAENMIYNGIPGHLATITSVGENEFLNTSFFTGLDAKFAWIAGYEPLDDGVWLWGSGPESGIQFALNVSPTPPFYYANWGGVEPNDYNPGEDFAAFNIGFTFANVGPGQWIDSPNPNPDDPIVAFIVEYEAENIPMIGSFGLLIAVVLLLIVGTYVMILNRQRRFIRKD